MRQEPPPTPGERPSDRHVRDAGAHRLQLSPHRPSLRRTGSHHRHVRGRQDPRSDDRASPHVRAGHRAHRPHPAGQQQLIRVDNAVERWGNPAPTLDTVRCSASGQLVSGTFPQSAVLPGDGDSVPDLGTDDIAHNPQPLLQRRTLVLIEDDRARTPLKERP